MRYLELGGFNPAEYNLPVDPRLVLSIKEMASIGNISPDPLTGKLDNGILISLPRIYFCVCKETSKIYVFNVNNEYVRPFGRFREVSGSGGGSTVIPNPDLPATETLEKVQIDDTVYSIPSGGSSDLISSGTVPPSEETEGDVGHLYIDQAAPNLYQCTQLDNSIIYDDPGTELPIYLGKGWKNIEVTGIEQILSNGGAPQPDTVGIRGQLFVDTFACELYQCQGQDTQSLDYIWERVHKSTGFNLILGSNDVPYKVLYSNGTWSVPVGGQREFRDVVAFAIADNQSVIVVNGLLSSKHLDICDNKAGYTLISDAVIKIQKN